MGDLFGERQSGIATFRIADPLRDERLSDVAHNAATAVLDKDPELEQPGHAAMKENPADPRTVLCDDCLAPEGYGEIIGGSQREDDYDKLLARIKEEGLPLDAYGWYLDLRRYGTVPHSGFGLGLERTLLFLSGMANIRDVIPFPRTPGSAEY